MKKHIKVYPHIKKGIGKNHRSYLPINTLAGDIETSQGKPILLQLKSPKQESLIEVTPETIEDEFLNWLEHNTYDKARYQKKNGHRQTYTRLVINDIVGPGVSGTSKPRRRKKAETEEVTEDGA